MIQLNPLTFLSPWSLFQRELTKWAHIWELLTLSNYSSYGLNHQRMDDSSLKNSHQIHWKAPSQRDRRECWEIISILAIIQIFAQNFGFLHCLPRWLSEISLSLWRIRTPSTRHGRRGVDRAPSNQEWRFVLLRLGCTGTFEAVIVISKYTCWYLTTFFASRLIYSHWWNQIEKL